MIAFLCLFVSDFLLHWTPRVVVIQRHHNSGLPFVSRMLSVAAKSLFQIRMTLRRRTEWRHNQFSVTQNSPPPSFTLVVIISVSLNFILISTFLKLHSSYATSVVQWTPEGAQIIVGGIHDTKIILYNSSTVCLFTLLKFEWNKKFIVKLLLFKHEWRKWYQADSSHCSLYHHTLANKTKVKFQLTMPWWSSTIYCH